MTLILYDYCELEEKTSKRLKIWKAWHISLYALAALFGVMNYTFLEGTMQLYNENCILFPRNLAFHEVEAPCSNETVHETNESAQKTESETAQKISENAQITNEVAQITNETSQNAHTNETVPVQSVDEVEKTINRDKRENPILTSDNSDYEIQNVTVIYGCTGNETSWRRPALDVGRTLFGVDSECQWALYTPLASTVFAAVWVTLFTMCPGGGRPKDGLQQPWRILAPALLFAVILAAFTGHNFSRTSSGIHVFCASFSNYTNSTTCSPVTKYTELAWNKSMGIGGRVAATRAACAGVWISWACAAALLLARCLAAPDFTVHRTGVLLRDPHQKITNRLKKLPKKQNVQFALRPNSPRDDASLRSEPTYTSELVTASVDHHDDSTPSSAFNTPVRRNDNFGLEMTPILHMDERTTPDQYK